MEPRFLTAALGVASGSAPASAPPATDAVAHVMIAGAIGRLGEAFVNAALARPGIQRVTVLVQQAFSHAPTKLQGVDEARWLGMPAPDALILLPELDHEGLRRLGNARDAVYASLAEPVMQRLLTHPGLGQMDVLLIHPVAAWQQLGAFQQGLAGALEEQVAACGARSVTIVRPILSATTSTGSWLQRTVNVYLSLQLLLLPRSLPSLTSAQIAARSLKKLADARTGVRVFGMAELGGN